MNASTVQFAAELLIAMRLGPRSEYDERRPALRQMAEAEIRREVERIAVREMLKETPT